MVIQPLLMQEAEQNGNLSVFNSYLSSTKSQWKCVSLLNLMHINTSFRISKKNHFLILVVFLSYTGGSISSSSRFQGSSMQEMMLVPFEVTQTPSVAVPEHFPTSSQISFHTRELGSSIIWSLQA